MKLWLVVLQDKELDGEPHIGMCIIESDDENDARIAGASMVFAALCAGRHRCVPRWREIERGFKYRTSALLRIPRQTG